MPSHFGTTGGQKTKLELQGLAEGTVVVSLTLLCGPAHTAMLAGQLAAHSQSFPEVETSVLPTAASPTVLAPRQSHLLSAVVESHAWAREGR